MSKLRLQLDDLWVDSFETAAERKEPGTVFGEECTCPTNCTCPGCPTCPDTCAESCGGTCYITCEGDTCWGGHTCYDSCGYTCYFSDPCWAC